MSKIISCALLLSCLMFSSSVCWADQMNNSAAPPLTHGDSVRMGEDMYVQGYQEYEHDHLDSALALFSKAVTWDSLHAGAWHGLGSTLARLNRHAEAQNAFDRCLALKPDHLMAWWHRGCDNAVAGRAEEALADLRHAIALDSSVKHWPPEDPCWKNLLSDPRLLEITR
jgi:tetratricopeptide (TPR) repeat protein